MMLLAAFIWGTTFVAQRIGMNYIGPFAFNALRFLMGAFVVLLFKGLFYRKDGFIFNSTHLTGGFFMGLALFSAITFQQWGLVYTTAGKAGFITGLYVVFVPIAGMFVGKKSVAGHFAGALLALVGLYLLSIKAGFSIEKGDFLVFLGSLCWTVHVLLIDSYTTHGDPFSLSLIQFLTTSLLSLPPVFVFEHTGLSNIKNALVYVLYAGVLSSGVAYTLQVVAQKFTHHSHAAIILSLESVFAALAGYVMLSERFTGREITGGVLMVVGMIVSQLHTSLTDRQKRI